jgi:hypothetical protein
MTNQTPDPVEPAADASHPDVETLADLSEDLLPEAEAAALRTHLAGCPECADTLAALTEVAALLAADQVPPMPADVALRLDAALADAQPPSAPSPTSAPGTPGTPHPAAAPSRAAAGPPTRSDRGSRPAGARPRRRRRLVLAAAACLAALGVGTAGLALSGQSSLRPAAASGAAQAVEGQRPMSATGPQFTAAGLPEEIQRLLPPSPGAGAAQPHSTTRQDESAPAAGRLPDCVERAVTGHAGESPLVVAHGGYQGAPVDVYVFRLAADPTRLDVFLLTPGCTTAPATVLLQQQIPAH